MDIPAEGVKDKVITMRTTARTHARLKVAAAAEGRSLSAWLIGLGLEAAGPQARTARKRRGKRK